MPSTTLAMIVLPCGPRSVIRACIMIHQRTWGWPSHRTEELFRKVKAAIFTSVPYMGPAPRGMWPVPSESFSAEVAERSMDTSLEQFELADQLGFDWVTLAEHHFAPMSMTPNPMVMAGALTQRVKNAKIALLGANIPILNPLRVAEEVAMLA